MFYPEFEKIKDYKEKFNLIPVSISLFADMDTPNTRSSVETEKFCFLLESVEGSERLTDIPLSAGIRFSLLRVIKTRRISKIYGNTVKERGIL